ncbi:T9SS type A sorting domain-containing protein [Chryseobacterium caseinilyticum]|uniref:T9SS type A sorting domain-containing protein n=1 Tax=Chryseobacterium caseinilyticum TaxID=2771428 RepID=A0ABR8ZFG9_9FLAO|nr:T9SS type A sorting domain-containing protein [Chryseobacterium caseinilyticum]MBD8083992.1 T9SS type A sorting domain-containing protein [Chryseobacterium caseinilyticum]
MKKIYSLLAICIFTVSMLAQTTLAEWAPNSTNTPGGSLNFGPSPFAATTSDTNLTIGGLTRGAGYVIPASGSGAALAWGGTDLTSTDIASAISAEDFATFTITANAGYQVSFSGIDPYNVRRSATGPTSGQWQYQIGTGSFNNIGSVITWGSATNAGGNEQPAIDLSTVTALQNVPAGTTVTFRILGFGASGSGGTWYVVNANAATTSKTLTVKGSVQTSTLAVSDFKKVTSNFVKNTLVKNNEIVFGSDVKDIKVYTLSGAIVKTGEVKNGSTLNVAELAKGNYIVTGIVNNEPVSQKILKD